MITGRRLVVVKWHDAYGCSPSWRETCELRKSLNICYSAGWLIFDGEAVVIIGPHISPDDDSANIDEQICGDMTIPKSAIISIRDVYPDPNARVEDVYGG